MEQKALKNANNCLNTKITSYPLAPCGKKFDPYSNIDPIFYATKH
jgi:hypothetical protein